MCRERKRLSGREKISSTLALDRLEFALTMGSYCIYIRKHPDENSKGSFLYFPNELSESFQAFYQHGLRASYVPTHESFALGAVHRPGIKP